MCQTSLIIGWGEEMPLLNACSPDEQNPIFILLFWMFGAESAPWGENTELNIQFKKKE